MRPMLGWFASAAAFTMVSLAPAQAQPADAVSPEIRQALDRMANALKALSTYELRADVTTEEVLDTGQKLQSSSTARITARRPNRLYVDLDSERRKRRLFYDGKQLTIYGPVNGYYATIAAPATTQQLVRDIADRFDVETPLADLFEWGASGVRLNNVESAMYAGPDRINGAICEHYAFTQDGTDWQLWIRRDGTPLPCKLVIVNTDDPSQPQTTAVLNWAVGQPVAESQFKFVPPAGAHPIQLAQTADAAPKEPGK